MWSASTKNDLIIEVWKKLECKSVGAAEIEAIETVIRDMFGKGAVDSPMKIARLLADAGAALRHAEIMALYVKRVSERPYDAALRNLLKLDDLKSALDSIRSLENLRRKYTSEGDREGLRKVREVALRGKNLSIETANCKDLDSLTRQTKQEIANWLTIWLQTPELFEHWVTLRIKSRDFNDKFGKVG